MTGRPPPPETALAENDSQLLARALTLAEKGLYTATPNPRVGCVIVKDGVIAGEGWHARAGEAHAEILALAAAGDRAAGGDVYVSLEPCAHHGKTPPCTDALIAAAPARVIIAMPDPNPQVNGAGAAALTAAGIQVRLAAAGSDMRRRAEQLNLGFISRMTRARPWIRLKIAATLDGKTALGSGLSRWISGEAARRDAHHLRAAGCAVMTGIGTALQDDPQLTVRHVSTPRQPLRVLVDSQLRATPGMRLFDDDNILAATARAAPADFPAETLQLPTADGKVDLLALAAALARRGVNDVLVEAGRQLNGALLADGLADEIVLYLAGCIFGEGGRDMFKFPPPASPDEAPRYRRVGLTAFDDGDIKITYRRRQSPAAR